MLSIPTFKERVEYLQIPGFLGEETFGGFRWVNQDFYKSKEWKDVRRRIIVRDCGCDLAIDGREISDRIIVHHINPLDLDSIVHSDLSLFDPENLVCVSYDTHNIIHFGNIENLSLDPVVRKPNDTCPWKR